MAVLEEATVGFASSSLGFPFAHLHCAGLRVRSAAHVSLRGASRRLGMLDDAIPSAARETDERRAHAPDRLLGPGNRQQHGSTVQESGYLLVAPKSRSPRAIAYDQCPRVRPCPAWDLRSLLQRLSDQHRTWHKKRGRSNNTSISDGSLPFNLDAIHQDLRAVVVRDVAEQRAIEMNDLPAVAERLDLGLCRRVH